MEETKKMNKYESKFASRLRDLMKERKVTQQTLAEAIGGTRQAVSQYADGSVLPNIDKLNKMADFFNLSSDYLLARTDIKTPDVSIKEISHITGLNEDAIKELKDMKEYIFSDYLKWLNELIVNRSILKLLSLISQYETAYYNYLLYMNTSKNIDNEFSNIYDKLKKGEIDNETFVKRREELENRVYKISGTLLNTPWTKERILNSNEPEALKTSPQMLKELYEYTLQKEFIEQINGTLMKKFKNLVKEIDMNNDYKDFTVMLMLKSLEKEDQKRFKEKEEDINGNKATDKE